MFSEPKSSLLHFWAPQIFYPRYAYGDACAINSEAEFNISLLVLFVILGKNLYNDISYL